MTVPMRRSSVASAMMRSSMDDADALAGLRLLVAGGDLAAVQAAQARLAALGADATALAGDVDALARAAAAAPPAAVLAVDALEAPLRARLDPFGLERGAAGDRRCDALAAADDGVGRARRRRGCARSSSGARCARARPSSRPRSPPRR